MSKFIKVTAINTTATSTSEGTAYLNTRYIRDFSSYPDGTTMITICNTDNAFSPVKVKEDLRRIVELIKGVV